MSKQQQSKHLSRRHFLMTSAAFLAFSATTPSFAKIIQGVPAWDPGEINMPEIFPSGRWYVLNMEEVAMLGAIAERLIPADSLSISGKDAGCVEFIDRQLAGSYGNFAKLYMQPPFKEGTATQGDQLALTPRERYRMGLIALSHYCTNTYNKSFVALDGATQDIILRGMEMGEITLEFIDAKMFFNLVLQNVMEGFFADPIYGGNKDMVSWKMLGFPGAHYDYRAFINKHNKKINIEPISISGLINQAAKG